MPYGRHAHPRWYSAPTSLDDSPLIHSLGGATLDSFGFHRTKTVATSEYSYNFWDLQAFKYFGEGAHKIGVGALRGSIKRRGGSPNR